MFLLTYVHVNPWYYLETSKENKTRSDKLGHYPTSVLRRRVEELRGRTAPFCSPEWMDEFNRVRSAMH